MGKHETKNYEQNMLVSGNCCSLNMFLLMSLSFLKGKLKRMRVGSYNFLLQNIQNQLTCSHLKWFENASCLPCSEMYPPSIPPRLEKPHLQQLNLISRQRKCHIFSSQPFFVRNQPFLSIRKPDFECWNLQILENWNPQKYTKHGPTGSHMTFMHQPVKGRHSWLRIPLSQLPHLLGGQRC